MRQMTGGFWPFFGVGGEWEGGLFFKEMANFSHTFQYKLLKKSGNKCSDEDSTNSLK